MPRIPEDKETMQVNLQLLNGNRVEAVIRVEDSDKVFTQHAIDPQFTERQP
jgi:hypothetical protein